MLKNTLVRKLNVIGNTEVLSQDMVDYYRLKEELAEAELASIRRRARGHRAKVVRELKAKEKAKSNTWKKRSTHKPSPLLNQHILLYDMTITEQDAIDAGVKTLTELLQRGAFDLNAYGQANNGVDKACKQVLYNSPKRVIIVMKHLTNEVLDLMNMYLDPKHNIPRVSLAITSQKYKRDWYPSPESSYTKTEELYLMLNPHLNKETQARKEWDDIVKARKELTTIAKEDYRIKYKGKILLPEHLDNPDVKKLLRIWTPGLGYRVNLDCNEDTVNGSMWTKHYLAKAIEESRFKGKEITEADVQERSYSAGLTNKKNRSRDGDNKLLELMYCLQWFKRNGGLESWIDSDYMVTYDEIGLPNVQRMPDEILYTFTPGDKLVREDCTDWEVRCKNESGPVVSYKIQI